MDSRNVKLPSNWQNFLALEENKRNCAQFLSEELSMVTPDEEREIVAAGGFSMQREWKHQMRIMICQDLPLHKKRQTHRYSWILLKLPGMNFRE